jgi:hypothetical protein
MLAASTYVDDLGHLHSVIGQLVIGLPQELLHQFVVLVCLISLSWNLYLLGSVDVTVLTVPALSVSSTTKGVELLVFGQDQSMESTTGHLLYSFVGQGGDSFGLLLEIGVAVAALAFVELGSFSTAPGVEVAVCVKSGAVVVATGYLLELFPFKPLNRERFI